MRTPARTQTGLIETPQTFKTSEPAQPKSNNGVQYTPDNQPIIIAHSDGDQPFFDGFGWGVQWEIARLVSNGKITGYDKLDKDKLRQWKGVSNAEAAPNIEKVLSPKVSQPPGDRIAYERAFRREIETKASSILTGCSFFDRLFLV
jgi:hypothetical protein